MILFLLSLLNYSVDLNSYKGDTFQLHDINFNTSTRISWFSGFLEGTLRSEFVSSDFNAGVSDLLIGAGLSREILGFDFCLQPLFQYSTGHKGKVRSYSINGNGYGIRMGLGCDVLYSDFWTDFRFIEYETEPNIKSIHVNSGININPDTLTFGIKLSYLRYMGNDFEPYSAVYVTPRLFFERWTNIALELGVDFRISRDRGFIDELNRAGITNGNAGTPPWRVLFGVRFPGVLNEVDKLIPLRILLLDEEGNLASGLLSLADSGSFEITEGEINFKLPRGIYPLSIYSKDCLPVDTTIVLNDRTELLLTVKHRESFGIVEGKVIDNETGKPVYSKLEITNSKNSVTYTNPELGTYRVVLTPGDYVFHAEANGYYTRTSLIEVRAGDISELNFELLPSGED